MASAAEVRDAQRAAWASLSSAWETWDRIIMDQLRPVTDALVAHLRPSFGARHLDVASGTGEPGLTIARSAPATRVVLTDLSSEMLDVARRRADALGVTNIETRVCAADDLPYPDASFATVSVRFGYMFFPDLAAATAELARVLAPGGRLGAAVWVEPERNPWTSIAMAAIATETELPPPDPDGPSMYRCARPGQLGRLFTEAGLREVAEVDVPIELVTASAEEYWDMISDHVSLVAAALRRVGEGARARLRAHAIDAVGAYERGGAIRVPGLARCAVGTKAGDGR